MKIQVWLSKNKQDQLNLQFLKFGSEKNFCLSFI